MCLPPTLAHFPYATLFRSLDRGVHVRVRPVLVVSEGDAVGQPPGQVREGVDGPLPLGTPRCVGDDVAHVRDEDRDRKSTRLNSSHVASSYAVFCLKKKKTT